MKLQLTIGTCTVNTTFKGLSKVFNEEDARIFENMLTVGSSLQNGVRISQTIDGVDYSVRLIK